ncbi:uncharacterized protein B0T23DRAFT_90520 [Neurospora hispaniola]|uniref:Uncharacterized protein n=1 Tax=Neurospora hispaniola TaxID=588809 RepID=A0AAJ0IDB6_9PEZI|nr:hypothetical protein B0T23DRAFT_90520 [Neurospora hispaniola]
MCNRRVTGLANLVFLTPPSAQLLLEIGAKHNKAMRHVVQHIVQPSRLQQSSDVMMGIFPFDGSSTWLSFRSKHWKCSPGNHDGKSVVFSELASLSGGS